MSDFVPRFPWPPDFPDVFVHSDLKTRDADPDFDAAKAGDRQAALRLAMRLTSRAVMADYLQKRNAVLLPVTALETSGFNAIPDAMARVMGAAWALSVIEGAIVQSNRVGHTRSSGWHRIVTPAKFTGPVEVGQNYVLVDDHVGFGGTLANLRGHIEANGGHVIAMTTLSETRDARTIAIRPETLSVLRNRHGQELENLWQATFGQGLDCLTNVEAGYLARQLSVDAIRDRMVEAAEQARRRGLPAVAIQNRR